MTSGEALVTLPFPSFPVLFPTSNSLGLLQAVMCFDAAAAAKTPVVGTEVGDMP